MKIIVEYDPPSGNVIALNGNYIGLCHGLETDKYEEKESEKVNPTQINSLREAGFTADELIAMRKEGLI